jgi:cytochrome b561
MSKFLRYHPLLVILHWLLAVLIIAALALGALVMVNIPNSDPMKIEALRSHMAGGAVILLLMLARLLVRNRTAHPAPAATGHTLLDWLAWGSHRRDRCPAFRCAPCELRNASASTPKLEEIIQCLCASA